MRIRKDKKIMQISITGKQETILCKGFSKKTVRFVKNSRVFIQKIVKNHNFMFQLLVVIFTLTSENGQMDRKIEGMSSTIDKIKNITDILNSTMRSVRIAAEAPEKIRQIL